MKRFYGASDRRLYGLERVTVTHPTFMRWLPKNARIIQFKGNHVSCDFSLEKISCVLCNSKNELELEKFSNSGFLNIMCLVIFLYADY